MARENVGDPAQIASINEEYWSHNQKCMTAKIFLEKLIFVH